MDCRPSGCKERQLTTWETRTKFNKSRNPLERVLFLETQLLLTLGSHSEPPSYSVSWHFLTLTSARSVSHHYSCKCHAQSKTVFSTNKEITTWYKSIYTQNKSHHTTVLWCVCNPTCVRTYRGTRRARHRCNSRSSAVSTHIRIGLYNKWMMHKLSRYRHTVAYGGNGKLPLILW